MKGLQPGDQFPSFKLPDHNGNQRSLEDWPGLRVVYFYPADETPGCTKQACSFRDNYEAFTDAGATVIGISDDSIATHAKF
ncbi:MAG: peroxiredoxin, partial [Thermoplasmatota archaeon]